MSVYSTHKGLRLEEISPHEWPVRVGELCILLSYKPGYCAVVERIDNNKAYVVLLDWPINHPVKEIPLYDCIPTRKTPWDLVSLYEPSPEEFSQALVKEREFPDFDSQVLAKSRRTSGTKSKSVKKPKLKKAELLAALANLSDLQKEALKKLLAKKGDL